MPRTSAIHVSEKSHERDSSGEYQPMEFAISRLPVHTVKSNPKSFTIFDRRARCLCVKRLVETRRCSKLFTKHCLSCTSQQASHSLRLTENLESPEKLNGRDSKIWIPNQRWLTRENDPKLQASSKCLVNVAVIWRKQIWVLFKSEAAACKPVTERERESNDQIEWPYTNSRLIFIIKMFSRFAAIFFGGYLAHHY